MSQNTLNILNQNYNILRDKQFRAKRNKCKLTIDTINYFGTIVSRGKLSVDPDKTDSIYSWPVLNCVKEVQQFLGLVKYYNQFIKQFEQIASLFTRLQQKGIDFVWYLEYESAFQLLKDKLCSDPVLHLLDFKRPFVIEIDCSDYQVRAALLYKYDDEYHPVKYYSYELIPTESNYALYDCGLLAIFRSAYKWRCSIDGSQVTV